MNDDILLVAVFLEIRNMVYALIICNVLCDVGTFRELIFGCY